MINFNLALVINKIINILAAYAPEALWHVDLDHQILVSYDLYLQNSKCWIGYPFQRKLDGNLECCYKQLKKFML